MATAIPLTDQAMCWLMASGLLVEGSALAQIVALVASKLAARTGDRRFDDYFTYIRDGRSEVYLQRILDAGSATRGYKIDALHAKAQEGVPALMMTRTNPRNGGYEQTHAKHDWWDWYAPYLSARQTGSSPEQAAAVADRYMDQVLHVPAR